MAEKNGSEEASLSHKNEMGYRKAKSLLSAVAAAAATISFVATFGQLATTAGDTNIFGDRRAREAHRQDNAEALSQIRALRTEVDALKRAQSAIKPIPAGVQIAIQNDAILNRVEGIDQRLHSLEQAISNSPEKALALPMIRRDIDNLRDNNAQSMSAIKQSIDQIYDLTKWLLGALAVGVFSLAIANFFTKK